MAPAWFRGINIYGELADVPEFLLLRVAITFSLSSSLLCCLLWAPQAIPLSSLPSATTTTTVVVVLLLHSAALRIPQPTTK